MGMSIDEAKQSLSYYQKLFNSLNGDYRLSQVQASELSHSIDTALEIIHKYQKIKDIVFNEDRHYKQIINNFYAN